MKVMYDRDLNYVELFFSSEANYGESLSEHVMQFRSEKSDEIVGYSFENAKTTVFEAEFLTAKTKLAVLLKMVRVEEQITQQYASEITAISFRHYQRLEAGEDNPTLDILESLKGAFPEADFSLILKPSRKDVA